MATAFAARPVTADDAKPCPEGYKDYTGMRRGKLTVLGFSRRSRPKGKVGSTFWVVRCDCGNVWEISTSNLGSRGVSMCFACGQKAAGETNKRHPLSHTVSYQRWKTLLANHGDRVCKSWQDFDGFLRDMGECTNGASHLRYPHEGTIRKCNCYWSNKKNPAPGCPKYEDFFGKGATLESLGNELGLTRERVRQKIERAIDLGLDVADHVYGRDEWHREREERGNFFLRKLMTDEKYRPFLTEEASSHEFQSEEEAIGFANQIRGYVNARNNGKVRIRHLGRFLLIQFEPEETQRKGGV